MLRRILIFGFAFVVLLICVIASIIGVELSSMRRQANAVYSNAEQHLASHEAELAEALAEVLSKHPSGSKLEAELLPVALQLPALQLAVVDKAHVTLIVYTNPDTDIGYRVWSGEQSAEFDDELTLIPGVYKFRYCDDYPESPNNRPSISWGK